MMRLGLITAIAVLASGMGKDDSISRRVGHAVTGYGRSVMRRPGEASELSEQLTGASCILLLGHVFDSVME